MKQFLLMVFIIFIVRVVVTLSNKYENCKKTYWKPKNKKDNNEKNGYSSGNA